MRHRITAVQDLNGDDVDAWRELARDAIEPNPLFEPACVISAAKHLARGAQIHLVIAEEDGRFFGCMPVAPLEGGMPPRLRPHFLSRPAATTMVRRLRYDGTPLLRLERRVEAATALVGALIGSTALGRPGFLVLESVHADGLVDESLREALESLNAPFIVLQAWTRPVIRRSEPDGPSVQEPNRRKLEKLLARMNEGCGDVVRIHDVSDNPSMVTRLIAMEAAGYKSSSGIAMLSHDGEPEWFEEMCDCFREEGRLEVLALTVGDAVVALQLMVRGGDTVLGLQSTYDEAYGRFSPGIILHRAFVERFYASSDVSMKDTCTYEGNTTLMRVYPHHRSMETLVVVTGGWVDRVLLRVYTGIQRMAQSDTSRGRDPSVWSRAARRLMAALGLTLV